MGTGREKGKSLSKETLNNEQICLVCNQKLKNPISLSKHIQHQHQLKTKEYCDKYLRKNGGESALYVEKRLRL